jgi:hypothetical protein
VCFVVCVISLLLVIIRDSCGAFVNENFTFLSENGNAYVVFI